MVDGVKERLTASSGLIQAVIAQERSDEANHIHANVTRK